MRCIKGWILSFEPQVKEGHSMGWIHWIIVSLSLFTFVITYWCEWPDFGWYMICDIDSFCQSCLWGLRAWVQSNGWELRTNEAWLKDAGDRVLYGVRKWNKMKWSYGPLFLPAKRNSAQIGLVTDGGVKAEELPHTLAPRATSIDPLLAGPEVFN